MFICETSLVPVNAAGHVHVYNPLPKFKQIPPFKPRRKSSNAYFLNKYGYMDLKYKHRMLYHMHYLNKSSIKFKEGLGFFSIPVKPG
jgi:hypothetical protein